MKSLFREYLRLGRGERSAVLFLLTLICLLLVARYYVRTETKRMDYSGMLEMIRDIKISDFREKIPAKKNQPHRVISNKPFDPNTASQSEMESQGIPAFIAGRIVKFRKAGGGFEKAEDLLTIYGFTEEKLKALKPFIRIKPREKERTEKSSPLTEITERKIIPLNRADSAAFTSLPGIGPAYAKRIIRYRKLLGGFSSKGQLLEVYGFTPELYQQIEGLIILDSVEIQKLNINVLTKEEIAAHPYFSYRLARNIVQYRQEHGLFSRPEELRQIFSISDSVYHRIRPYVVTQ